ncbi:MAG: hypothetical protein ACM3JD_03425, partial [Rudaea sp.]
MKSTQRTGKTLYHPNECGQKSRSLTRHFSLEASLHLNVPRSISGAASGRSGPASAPRYKVGCMRAMNMLHLREISDKGVISMPSYIPEPFKIK